MRKRIACLVIGQVFKNLYQHFCNVIGVSLYGRRKSGPSNYSYTYGSLHTNYNVMLVRGIKLDFLRSVSRPTCYF